MESPFQLIQAIELKKEVKDIKFLIRLNGSDRNNQQIRQVVKTFNLPKVIYVPVKYKVLLLIFLFPFLFMSLFSKKVYIGDENSIVFKLVKYFISKRKLVLLDDGVATLNSKLNGLYSRYTIFSGVDGDKNQLSECRRVINGKINSNNINVNVIVGSKLVEEGICDQNSYFDLLDDMVMSIASSSYKTIYIPHRGECYKNLAAISSRYRFEIINNELPIELIGYELSVVPVGIFSVMSTALFSMSLIYSNATIRVYPLESNKILSRKEGVENLYEIMKKNALFVR